MSRDQRMVIITTINPPSDAVKKIAALPGWTLVVVGDRKTPDHWSWPGAKFLSIGEQLQLDSDYAKACPENHYARKNVGYLYAIAKGCEVIAETDDDNIPYDTFLGRVDRRVRGGASQRKGWDNVYTYFTSERIWPRGFPLDLINTSLDAEPLLEQGEFDCPVQQYLADGDPDVDAIYRLTTVREVDFDQRDPVVLRAGTFCPFNSQNTIWWPEAYPLLYLPALVSFRMTDIWRSFVAQACLYAAGQQLSFHSATVRQVRNEHSLLRDFRDEIPGYLNNTKIMDVLTELPLSSNPADAGANLRRCYERLVALGVVPEDELRLIDLWLADLASGRK